MGMIAYLPKPDLLDTGSLEITKCNRLDRAVGRPRLMQLAIPDQLYCRVVCK